MRRLCLTGFLALTLASCNDSSTAPVSDLDALQISVRAEPATIVAGTAANVVLTLKNPLNRPVVVSACPIYFRVVGDGGQIVGGSNGGVCLAAASIYAPLRFDPLETKTVTRQWLASETQGVPPGVYDLFGWVNDPARASPPACITVVPASGTPPGLRLACAGR